MQFLRPIDESRIVRNGVLRLGIERLRLLLLKERRRRPRLAMRKHVGKRRLVEGIAAVDRSLAKTVGIAILRCGATCSQKHAYTDDEHSGQMARESLHDGLQALQT